jgi:hypothetical protein
MHLGAILLVFFLVLLVLGPTSAFRSERARSIREKAAAKGFGFFRG